MTPHPPFLLPVASMTGRMDSFKNTGFYQGYFAGNVHVLMAGFRALAQVGAGPSGDWTDRHFGFLGSPKGP
jgi:hypothetical protein